MVNLTFPSFGYAGPIGTTERCTLTFVYVKNYTHFQPLKMPFSELNLHRTKSNYHGFSVKTMAPQKIINE